MCTRMCVWSVTGVMCAIGGIGVGGAFADTATLNALKDNTLYQNDFGETSNGAGAYFFAGINGNGEIRRGLIAFDLSSIPPGATIQSVTLRLRMSRTTDGPEPVTLHRVLRDWGEGTSNASANEGMGAPATPGDATWIHTRFATEEWTDGTGTPAPGGYFDEVASATSNVDQIAFYTWTGPGLAADVERWVNKPQGNFGWMIRGFEDGASTAKRFDSRNNNTVANRPQLVVEYAPPAAMCPCDMNGDLNVTSADFFDFLTAFFNMDPAADFDGSGMVNSADFFGFLTCFFQPPAGCA